MRNKSLILFLILGVVFFSIGCKEEGDIITDKEPTSNEKSGPNPNYAEQIDITDFDVKVPQWDYYDSYLIQYVINSSSVFYDKSPSATVQDTAQDPSQDTGSSCPALDKAFENAKYVENDHGSYDMTIKVSLVDCTDMSDILGPKDELVFDHYQLSMIIMDAKGVDQNGKNVDLSNVAFDDESVILSQVLMKMYMGFDFLLKAVQNKEQVQQRAQFSIKGIASNGNQACKHSSTSYESDCGIQEKTYLFQEVDSNGQKISSSQLLLTKAFMSKGLGTQPFMGKGLGTNQVDPYFTNGTIDFTFNNWDGTMTYGKDGTKAPTYVASYNKEKVCGTYGDSVSWGWDDDCAATQKRLNVRPPLAPATGATDLRSLLMRTVEKQKTRALTAVNQSLADFKSMASQKE